MPHPLVGARFRPSCKIEDFTPSPDALPANLDALANWTTAELHDQWHQRKTPTAQELHCQAPTNENNLTAETVILLVSECSLRPKVTGVITLQQFGKNCHAFMRLSGGKEHAVKHYMWLIIFMSANVLVQEKKIWPRDIDQILLLLFREHRYWKRSSDMTQANAGRCRLSSGHYARALSTLSSIIGDSAFGIPIKNPKLLYQFKQWVYLAPNDNRRRNQYAFAGLRPAKLVHTFLGGINSPIEFARIECILEPPRHLFFTLYSKKRKESVLRTQHEEAIIETALSMGGFGGHDNSNGTLYRACHEFTENAKKSIRTSRCELGA